MIINRHNILIGLVFCGLSISWDISLANEGTHRAQEINHGELHTLNVGKIVFSKAAKKIESYQAQEIITSLDLNNSKNLYFIGFLDRPLTQYLHEIAPELSIEDLNKKGNYQFSFYVNDKLTYTENLDFGAGLASQKSNDTVLLIPFFSERNEDSWGRFLWMRFMHFGGQDALTEGKHILKIEVRPYVKTHDITIGKIMAIGKLSIDVEKPIASESQIAIQPAADNSGLTLSDDQYDIERIRALNKKIAQKDFKDISAIVVLKNGNLLLEEYFNGSQRETLHDPRSVSKSIASTMLGIAIQDGHVDSEEAKLDTFYKLENFDNYSLAKSQVSLKDLLTMTSGFEGDDSDSSSIGNEENMYPTDNWVNFTLNLPMRSGERSYLAADTKQWAYFTAGTVLLGDVLNKAVPHGLKKYTKKALFEPLGINKYKWQFTPQDVVNTAGGLRLRALDFAKYGQLYKNDGVWSGKQIISKQWVKESLKGQVPRSDENDSGHYGYLFWNDTLTIGEHSLEVSYASGNGGNKIFIFKDIPFVIVITATAYNKAYSHKQINQMMENYLLPAILNER
ncbi:MAG: CubicO group peptidase (beta-lactamase class C family) [Glaciecola sp.]|jgi:CubicO group peptidase (beta-lactamase class C family)